MTRRVVCRRSKWAALAVRGKDLVSERELRKLAGEASWIRQRRMWQGLMQVVPSGTRLKRRPTAKQTPRTLKRTTEADGSPCAASGSHDGQRYPSDLSIPSNVSTKSAP